MGRKKSLAEDNVYARDLGIRRERLLDLGGAAKLKSLSPEARNILLGSGRYGNSKNVMRGGLIVRGMKRAKDIRSQYE